VKLVRLCKPERRSHQFIKMRVCQIWPRRVSLHSQHLDFLLHFDLLNIGQKLIIGLYYCELHAASQVELQAPEYRWKFNKARQGWLMRNVWNDTEVSTSH
jgi:hypothetical protein